MSLTADSTNELRTKITYETATSQQNIDQLKQKIAGLEGQNTKLNKNFLAAGAVAAGATAAIGILKNALGFLAGAAQSAARAMAEFAEIGGRLAPLSAQFQRLGGDMAALQRATNFEQSRAELMRFSNAIMSTGQVNREQMTELLQLSYRAAQAVGRPWEEIYDQLQDFGQGGGTTFLENLGINVFELERKVEAFGVSMEESAGRARAIPMILEDLRRQYGALGNETTTLTGHFGQLRTQYEDARDSFAVGLATHNQLREVFAKLSSVLRAQNVDWHQLGRELGDAAVTSIPLVLDGLGALIDATRVYTYYVGVMIQVYGWIIKNSPILNVLFHDQAEEAQRFGGQLREMFDNLGDVSDAMYTGADAVRVRANQLARMEAADRKASRAASGLAGAVRDANNAVLEQARARDLLKLQQLRSNSYMSGGRRFGEDGEIRPEGGSGRQAFSANEMLMASIENARVDAMERLAREKEAIRAGEEALEQRRLDMLNEQNAKLTQQIQLEEQRQEAQRVLAEQYRTEQRERADANSTAMYGFKESDSWQTKLNVGLDAGSSAMQSFGQISSQVFGALQNAYAEDEKALERLQKAQMTYNAVTAFVMAAIEIAKAIGSYPDIAGIVAHGLSAAAYITAGSMALAYGGKGTAPAASKPSTASAERKAPDAIQTKTTSTDTSPRITVYQVDVSSRKIGAALRHSTEIAKRSSYERYYSGAGGYV